MFCKNCGAELDDDALFCENCGTPIKKRLAATLEPDKEQAAISKPIIEQEEVSEPIREQESASEPIKEQEVVSESVREQESVSEPIKEQENIREEEPEAGNDNTPKEQKNKSKTALIAVIGVIAAVVIIAVVCLFRNLSENAVAEYIPDALAQCNYMNGGYFAYDDERIYFVGKEEKESEEKRIFSMKYDGTDKVDILNDSNVRDLRIAGDKILYSKKKNDTYSICMVNKDGTEQKEIVTSDNELSQYDQAGKKIYYLEKNSSDSYDLKNCELEGGNGNTLQTGVKDYVLAGKNLYWSDGDNLFSLDLKNGKSVEIAKDNEIAKLVYDEGTLFYITEEGLYAIPADGSSQAKIITKTKAIDFWIDGSQLYFIELMDRDTAETYAKILNNDKDDDDMYTILLYAFILSGDVYAVNKTGGSPSEVDIDQICTSYLGIYPEGAYCKNLSIFSTFEKVELK